MTDIDINDYDYILPDERIARYPAGERDMSQLLINRKNTISRDIFRNIGQYLPAGSVLVFNNTRVIRARILFTKETGASVEVLCLEPLSPVDYELSFGSNEPVEWKCLVGNLKKWKRGKITTSFVRNGSEYNLSAERTEPEGEAWRIKFDWGNGALSFGEVIDATGSIPLPPYLKRDEEESDISRYQTVYSRIKGSVAAPTAGLHFTEAVISTLKENGIKMAEITLHVGAGTFQPVKSQYISDHEMHCEHFFITKDTLQTLISNAGKIIPVGTTSVRTLESLYWLGIKSATDPANPGKELSLGQWEAYTIRKEMTANESLMTLLNYMTDNNLTILQASTSIIIVPGYKFRLINGMVTNFHQPRSTLLLLVSAWVGSRWKEIYGYALSNKFRFLSYGDCSLLLND